MNVGIRSSVPAVIAALLLVSAGMGLAIAQTDGATDATASNDTTATTAADGTWNTHRADDGRSGATSADGPTPYATETWNDSFTGVPVAAPTVANGSAYLGVQTEIEYYKRVGAIAAYNGTTGDLEWARTGLGSPAGAPAVADGTVYAATVATVPRAGFEEDDGEGGLYALDASTGETVWKRNESEKWTSPPIYVDGRLYTIRGPESIDVENRSGVVGPTTTGNSSLVALDPETGETTWSLENHGLVGIANDTLVSAADGDLVAYDLQSHEELWRTEYPDGFRTGLAAVSENGIYAVSAVQPEPLRVYGISLDDGTKQWTTTLSNETVDSYGPAITESAAYVTVNEDGANDSVVRLDHATGDVAWRYEPVSGVLSGSPTVANDSVLVTGRATPEASEPGEEYLGTGTAVYSLDAVDGSSEWAYVDRKGFGEWKMRAPSVAGESLFLTTNSNAIYSQYADGYLDVLESSQSAPGPAHTPSDGYYENDTTPTLSVEKTTTDPSDEFGAEKTVTLDASASVGQGEIDSIAWDVDGDGDDEHSGTSITVTLDQCEQRQVTVTATTSSGESVSETVSLVNEA